MNILILTGHLGFGHYSAAEAIKESILEEHPLYKVRIIDFIDYIFPNISKLIYSIFNFTVFKCHRLYNIINRFARKSSKVPLKTVVAKKIEKLLDENSVDMIISVLPICTQYISAYKKMTGNQITLNTCITDIEAHEEWISAETNRYYVASPLTKFYLEERGVATSKISITGIPVKTQFQKVEKTHTHNKILIMGGGLGLIPSTDEVLDYFENDSDYEVTIITGNNKRLFDRLVAKYKNIEVIGFTNEVYRYMKDADLIITKAGGITMFEAIHMETPILMMRPFLTQEVGNAKFIETYKIGRVIWNKGIICSNDVISLLGDTERLSTMRMNMRKFKSSLVETSYTRVD